MSITMVCTGDMTDEYVSRCGVGMWKSSKSCELADRVTRLRMAGKEPVFTSKLRSFIIHADHDTLIKLMLAWGRSGPFYSDDAMAKVKSIMGL